MFQALIYGEKLLNINQKVYNMFLHILLLAVYSSDLCLLSIKIQKLSNGEP